MTLSALNAISPVDGRYIKKTRALSPFFSEFGLIYYRLLVEVRWLESLADNPNIREVPPFDSSDRDFLNKIRSVQPGLLPSIYVFYSELNLYVGKKFKTPS